MKQLVVSICLMLSCVVASAQSKELIELKNDSLFISKVNEIVQKQTDSIVADSIKENPMTEYWNTRVFNPYKDVVVEYPFKITFKDSVYASPIKRRKRVVTSRYGWRRGRPHRAIDIDLVTGDRVYAMLAGKVRYVGYVTGHGRIVVVRHENGLETMYSHLSRYLVKRGDVVKKGQAIGKGGTTGNTRGSHLHLVVTYKGEYLNPEYLFDFGEGNKIRGKELWVTRKWTTPYLHNSRRQSKIQLCTTYEEALKSKQTQRKVYVVKRGDTLSEISTKYNVSIASLCRTNSIKRNSVLKIGQKLILTQ